MIFYKVLIFTILISIFPYDNSAQGLFESSTKDDAKKLLIDFSGYGRGSAYGGGETFDYSSVFAEFGIEGELSWKNAFLFTDLRLRAGSQYDSLYTTLQVKETYVGYQSNKLDVYFGAKIVSWGRTDGFNPTDNITPYDYFFLTPDADDQKLPNILMQSKWYILPQLDFEIILIPIYRPSIYRYDLFDLGSFTTFTDPSLPDKTFTNGSFGVRLSANLAKAGFSVSYFHGFDPFYGFNVYNISWEGMVPSIQLTAQPYLKDAIGADFSLAARSWIIRGEAAYNITKNYEDNMYIPNPNISYVAGVEHAFWGITTILQYVGQFTINFAPLDNLTGIENMNDMIIGELTEFNRKIFNQQEQFNHALSLSLSKSLAHETIGLEAMGYYNITSEEWFIRLKLKWHITDNLETSVGGFYSEGPDMSIYSYSSKVLNGAFIELKVNF